MKRVILRLGLILCVEVAAAAEPLLQTGDFMAIVGDSITEQRLYSVFMGDYLLMCQPIDQLRVAQFGWSGERAPGFLNRMANDVLRFQPTVMTTCYGMNDGGYAPLTSQAADTYRKAQEQIVAKAKEAGVRTIVVGSPGCVDTVMFRRDPAQAEMYNKTLAELRDIARDVAQSADVKFADVHTAMYEAMLKAKAKYGPEYHVPGGDGFHPDVNGQLVMAFAFLKALGCSGDIGTITVDMNSNHAEVTEGHKLLSCNQGTVELESSRYPFCFYGDPKSPSSTSGIIEFIPFNSELNRLILIVKDPPADNCKITWGNTSKQFSKAKLVEGINLAAEFLDNPFSEPFRKVDGLVRQQQAYETPLVKSFLTKLPEIKSLVPEDAATLDQVASSAIRKDRALFDQAAAAVTPVQHKILISAAP